MKALHYAFVLAVICVAAAFGVAGTYHMTRSRIEATAQKEREAAQAAAIPAEKTATLKFAAVETDADVVEAFDSSGRRVGYAAVGEAQGYGGRVRVMVGMDARAETVAAVTVVAQSETPGLGTRVAEVPSSKTWVRLFTGRNPEGPEATTSEFLRQFAGKKVEQIELGKGIDGISGATISSRAVTAAARAGAEKIVRAVSGKPSESVDAATGATAAHPDAPKTSHVAPEKRRNGAK